MSWIIKKQYTDFILYYAGISSTAEWKDEPCVTSEKEDALLYDDIEKAQKNIISIFKGDAELIEV